MWREGAGKTTALPGVRAREGRRRGFTVTWVEILDEAGAAALGKGVGRYASVDLGPYFDDRAGRFAAAAEVLAEELRPLLPAEGGVLVAGLGLFAFLSTGGRGGMSKFGRSLSEMTGGLFGKKPPRE